jgi:hypothetical protein
VTVNFQLAARRFSGYWALFSHLPNAALAEKTRAGIRIDIFTMATLANGPQNLINK